MCLLVDSVFIIFHHSIRGPSNFGTHTMTLMCINAKELAVRRKTKKKSTVTKGKGDNPMYVNIAFAHHDLHDLDKKSLLIGK